MKTKLTLILLALALFGAPATFVGCKSPDRTREAAVFDTCQSTYRLARESYKAVVKLHLSGTLNNDQRAEADKAWNQFRAAFTATMRGLTLDWNSATPEQLDKLTTNFLQLLKTL